MTTIELKKFLEEGIKVEHQLKSALGRINKTLNSISDYLNNFKILFIFQPLI